MKIKKIIKLSTVLCSLTALSFFPVISTKSNNYLNNNEKFNEFAFSSKKYSVNEWSSQLPLSISKNTNLFNELQNEIEFKLYLDVYKEKGSLQNRLNILIKKIQDNFKNLEINWKVKKSNTLPIVWFYFNNVQTAKYFINLIDSLNYVKRIVFYKKSIQFKEDKIASDRYVQPNTPYIKETIEKIKDDILLDEINMSQYRTSEFRNNYKISKIGILEVNESVLPKHEEFKYKPKIKLFYKKNPEEVHGFNVSQLAGGKKGIDKNAQIYFSNFNNNYEWQKAIEWLVLENGVRIINHSYGLLENKSTPYNDEAYFLDYISRKFGVVNVISAGNGYNSKVGKWIDGKKLSYNSIVVGATWLKKFQYYNDIVITSFSNRELEENHRFLPKPLVVAPGEIPREKNGEIFGTSYAAPIVTGTISNILKKFSNLDNDKYRVPASMSILASSARLPKYQFTYTKTNGFDNAYGAGLIDFEKMVEAANNTRVFSVSHYNKDFNVFYSPEFNLSKGDQIKLALSWMFNAGIITKDENAPELQTVNWWEWFFPTFALARQGALAIDYAIKNSNWKDTHIDKNRLTLKETKNRQNYYLFSNYDIYLQKLNSQGYWEDYAQSKSENSNVELINYKVKETGKYRYVVRKPLSSIFEHSVDDVISVSYTVNKGN